MHAGALNLRIVAGDTYEEDSLRGGNDGFCVKSLDLGGHVRARINHATKEVAAGMGSELHLVRRDVDQGR